MIQTVPLENEYYSWVDHSLTIFHLLVTIQEVKYFEPDRINRVIYTDF